MELIASMEYNGLVYTMVICKDCELLQCLEHHHPVSPDYVELDSTNIDEQRIWCQGQHKIAAYKKWTKDFNYLKYDIKYPVQLLDIGCGTGGFLDFIKYKNYGLYGFDASIVQSDFSRKAFPNVRRASSCSEYIGEYGEGNLLFDIVTMWDVLEHIRNPVGYLREIRRVIRPGGLIYISTPNGLAKLWKHKLYKLFSIEIDMRKEFMPWEHVFYYSTHSLQYLLKESGYKVVKVGAVPCYRRPLTMFEIARRLLSYSVRIFPSKAFQIYAWASVQE